MCIPNATLSSPMQLRELSASHGTGAAGGKSALRPACFAARREGPGTQS